MAGTLTLRHGNGCLVEGNQFFGQEAKGTGGIRIIGEDHIVRRNYLSGLTGDEIRSTITFMLGIPDSPLNGYFQVKRALVEENTIVDCKHPFNIGFPGKKSAKLPPMETVIRGNMVKSPKATIVEHASMLDGVSWQDNTFLGKELGIAEVPGIAQAEPKIEKRDLPKWRSDVGPTWWQEASR